MPFFENARQFEINGGNFHDVKGNQNNYNYDQSLQVSGQGNSAVYTRGSYYNGANNSITNTTSGSGNMMVIGQGAQFQGSPEPNCGDFSESLLKQNNDLMALYAAMTKNQVNNYGQNRSESYSLPVQPCNHGKDSAQGDSKVSADGSYYNGANNNITSHPTGDGNIMVIGQGAKFQGSPNLNGKDFSESLPKQNNGLMALRAAMPKDQVNNHGQNRSESYSPPQPCNHSKDSGQGDSRVNSRGPCYSDANNNITSNRNVMLIGQGAEYQGAPSLNGEDFSESLPKQNNDMMTLRAAMPKGQVNNHGQNRSESHPPRQAAQPCNGNSAVYSHGSYRNGANNNITSHPTGDGNIMVIGQNAKFQGSLKPNCEDFSESLPTQNNGLMALRAAMPKDQVNNHGQNRSESYSPPQPCNHGKDSAQGDSTVYADGSYYNDANNNITSHPTGNRNVMLIGQGAEYQGAPSLDGEDFSESLPKQNNDLMTLHAAMPKGPQLSPSGHHSQVPVNSAPANVQQVQINQSKTRTHVADSNVLVSQQPVSPPADQKPRPPINPLPVTESPMMSGTTLTNEPQPTHVTAPSTASACPTTTATESTTSSPVVTQAQTTPNSNPPSGPNLPTVGGTVSSSKTTSLVEDGRKEKETETETENKKKKKKKLFTRIATSLVEHGRRGKEKKKEEKTKFFTRIALYYLGEKYRRGIADC
ncbi:hypothetical protein AGABI2DRAFT_113550 [Agaricus bisporus var. bisporus H97]|uniref:hypothetical protein n=1 Tax=Agaricus bisporus var. bisporus (strain H97 / ATCC MYA-4626 / FGSC 10389) TaxID=936046 RepID=UPI00029F518E|nr:hypothetical protein AGABI2DRAFT_113550 [Agaricus bisporus var. bisporus H97]EKV50792.1 hypothetical protein AGABI2DRAFT_113550 [Agaricus bisporus var. bisporus H97]